MYKHVYGLTHNPFDKSVNAKDAYQTADFKECTARLDYLATNRGLALITASAGYGKTFAVRAFAARQNPNLVHTLYLCLSTVSPSEFYRQLSGALGLEPSFKKTDMFHSIQGHLEYLTVSKKIHVMVMVDEAQYLSAAILRDLKMLMNFSYDSRDCFSLCLLGQPALADTLSLQINEALRQRITVSYEFTGLKQSDAFGYVRQMMAVAGGSETLFEEAAVRAAHGGAQGSIRILGHILTGALTIAAQQKATSIDAEMVMGAVNEMAIR